MIKHLKSLLKIAVIFITAGTILMLSGFLFGGVGELSNEVSELVRVIRTGVSEMVERIPMLESITNINGFTLVVDKDEVSVSVNEQYETIAGDYIDLKLADKSEVQNLDISILSGSFTILPSSDENYGVVSKGEEEFQCYIENGTLYLSVFPKSPVSDKERELILYVPEGVEYEKVILFCSGEGLEAETALKGKTIDISAICGSNTFSKDLEFEYFTLNAGVGTLYFERISASDIKAEVSTAEVTIADMETDTLTASVGMGIISMNGKTSDDVTINCGMGEIRLKIAGMQDDYNYDISGSAESVQIGTDTLAGMMMERWIDNGSDKKIIMSCSMGSVKIEFEQ